MESVNLSPETTKRRMLIDRVKTSTVLCLLLHLGILSAMDYVFYIYRVFAQRESSWGFVGLFFRPLAFAFSMMLSLNWHLLVCGVIGLSWVNYRKIHFNQNSVQTTGALRARSKNFFYGICHFLVGLALGVSYLRFLSSRDADVKEEESSSSADGTRQLLDSSSLTVLSCGVTACYYFGRCLRDDDYVVEFPRIVTSVFSRLRGIILPTFRHAVDVISDIYLWGVIISVYLLFGNIFHDICCILTWSWSTTTGEVVNPTTFLGFLRMDFLYKLLFCQVFVIFTLRLMLLTMKVVLTKRVQFSTSDLLKGNNLSLQDSLVSDDPYLKRLAFYDLKLLTEFDVLRTRSLFALSHPGGNPKTWDSVSKACLAEIVNLTKSIDNHMRNLEISKNQKDEATRKPVAVGPTLEFRNPAFASDEEVNRSSRLSMRQLTQSNATNVVQPVSPWEILENPLSSVVSLTNMFRDQMKSHVLKFLSSCNVLKYLDARSNPEVLRLLENSEIVLWAINALTDIMILSCSMDNNGVVQKHLSTIITSIAEFFAVIEDLKYGRDGVPGYSTRYSHTKISTSPRINQRISATINALVQPLKNELHRVHFTFAPYYDIICIPQSAEKVLRKIAQD